MSADLRLLRLRARLVDVLASITHDVAADAHERCPYRALEDRCTFQHGCRNQLRGGATATCCGPRLNPAPPASA